MISAIQRHANTTFSTMSSTTSSEMVQNIAHLQLREAQQHLQLATAESELQAHRSKQAVSVAREKLIQFHINALSGDGTIPELYAIEKDYRLKIAEAFKQSAKSRERVTRARERVVLAKEQVLQVERSEVREEVSVGVTQKNYLRQEMKVC